jgi:hypothetical protein
MKKNLGFNLKKELAEQDGSEWMFGADSKFCLALIPESERDEYFPQGELQFGQNDFMDCASRSPLNLLETKFNFLVRNNLISVENHNWLVENEYFTDNGIEFSDRFVAVNSGTTQQGNSLKAPLDAIRKQGLIPKSMLPAKNNMTWQDYHNPEKITKKMFDLGREFTRRFQINYEKVLESDFGVLLGEDMLDVAGYAWSRPKNGIYPKVAYQANHAFMMFRNAFFVFDNYFDDGKKDDYIKHLARDYNFLDYGYRVFISSETVPNKNSFWQRLVQWLFERGIIIK